MRGFKSHALSDGAGRRPTDTHALPLPAENAWTVRSGHRHRVNGGTGVTAVASREVAASSGVHCVRLKVRMGVAAAAAAAANEEGNGSAQGQQPGVTSSPLLLSSPSRDGREGGREGGRGKPHTHTHPKQQSINSRSAVQANADSGVSYTRRCVPHPLSHRSRCVALNRAALSRAHRPPITPLIHR